jgi:phosphatidylglycerol:prolipoprotein diacylglycerol transferase
MMPMLVLGPFAVSTYTLLRVAGVAVFVMGLVLRLRRGCWPVTGWDLLLAVPFLQLGLLLGASLEVALPFLADYLFRGISLPPGWWGGQRALGALAGGALAGYLICRARRLPVGRCFDLFAVPLPLGIAVARVGCLLQGCCYGREATTWPALVLPDVHGLWASRYPTQLASILANLLIFAVLVVVERYGKGQAPSPLPGGRGQGRGMSAPAPSPPPHPREHSSLLGERQGEGGSWPFDGFLFLLFVVLHYGQRFVFEFWRVDSPPLVGLLSWTHLYCIVGVGLAAWGIARNLRIARKLRRVR